MKILLTLYFLLLSPILGCAQRGNMNPNDAPQARLDNLASILVRHEVGRVEVLQIPPRVLTRTRITPELLEKQFHYKMSVRDVRGGTYETELVAAVKSMAVHSESTMPDLRWAIVFYDLNDLRLVAVYIDKSGAYGAVDNSPVAIKGDLFTWLSNNFSKCFR